MNSRRIPLYVGLVLALGTGFLLLNFLRQTGSNSASAAMRPVVIAGRDIPARARISADMLTVVSRSSNQIDSDAITDPRRVAGNVSLITIPRGSTITRSKVTAASALAIPMRLVHGLRAVSVSIDRVKGVSGLIQPGDRVDVIAVSPRIGGETPKATSILRGALVLALGNETETASATPGPDNQNLTTVTLAVTPQQANLLALADVYTTLRLALRSPNEPLRSFPVEPIDLGSASASAPAPAPQAEPPAPAPALAALPEVHVAAVQVKPQANDEVEVIEGDRLVPSGERNR